jgi:type II secretory pathway component PulF
VQPQSRVFALVYPLVVLSFLGAATYGVLAPVLPILQTEVLAAAWMARAGDI